MKRAAPRPARLDLDRDETPRVLNEEVDLDAVVGAPVVDRVIEAGVGKVGAQLVQDEGLQEKAGLLLRGGIGEALRKRPADAGVEEVELGMADLLRRALELPGRKP